MTPGKMKTERRREERGKPTCMLLVKWKDRGYRKRRVDRVNRGRTGGYEIVLEWGKALERCNPDQQKHRDEERRQ